MSNVGFVMWGIIMLFLTLVALTAVWVYFGRQLLDELRGLRQTVDKIDRKTPATIINCADLPAKEVYERLKEATKGEDDGLDTA